MKTVGEMREELEKKCDEYNDNCEGCPLTIKDCNYDTCNKERLIKIYNTMFNVKEFSKKHLKTGMIVETEEGYRYVVLLDCISPQKDVGILSNIATGGWIPLRKYNDDLIYNSKYYKCFNITKVYEPKIVFDVSCLNKNDYLNHYKLVWERKNSIKLNKFEYDLLTSLKNSNEKFRMNNRNMFMKEKGYFKNVDIEMRLKDILSNCEVVENVD